MEVVVVLGASSDPGRYSYKAVQMLQEFGHEVFPISPKEKMILGIKTYSRLSDIKRPIDTLTMYVNPTISQNLASDIVKLKPGRVIFNPGSENPELQNQLERCNINVENACTLVLLQTHQF